MPTDTMMPVTPARPSTIVMSKKSGRTHATSVYSAIPLTMMPAITTRPSSR